MRRRAILAAVLVVGCERPPPPEQFVFVVPAGFHGFIKVVVDGRPSPAYRLLNGRHEFTVGRDGVVRLQDDSPFRHNQQTSGRDAAGVPIYGVHQAGTGADSLRIEWLIADEHARYLAVGTAAELVIARRMAYSSSGPLVTGMDHTPPVLSNDPTTRPH